MSALAPVLALALLAAAPKTAPAADSVETKLIAERTHALLVALSAKDLKGLLALLDASQALVLGPDVAEACGDAACIEKQARERFALFDSAKYGEPKKLHVQASPTLATAWFDVPAEVVTGKDKKSVTQRFATTWKVVGADWKLVQWQRFTPTVERSAREMLKENELK